MLLSSDDNSKCVNLKLQYVFFFFFFCSLMAAIALRCKAKKTKTKQNIMYSCSFAEGHKQISCQEPLKGRLLQSPLIFTISPEDLRHLIHEWCSSAATALAKSLTKTITFFTGLLVSVAFCFLFFFSFLAALPCGHWHIAPERAALLSAVICR